jgi:hypothetical protein
MLFFTNSMTSSRTAQASAEIYDPVCWTWMAVRTATLDQPAGAGAMGKLDDLISGKHQGDQSEVEEDLRNGNRKQNRHGRPQPAGAATDNEY